jgi:hypothetical protein
MMSSKQSASAAMLILAPSPIRKPRWSPHRKPISAERSGTADSKGRKVNSPKPNLRPIRFLRLQSPSVLHRTNPARQPARPRPSTGRAGLPILPVLNRSSTKASRSRRLAAFAVWPARSVAQSISRLGHRPVPVYLWACNLCGVVFSQSLLSRGMAAQMHVLTLCLSIVGMIGCGIGIATLVKWPKLP